MAKKLGADRTINVQKEDPVIIVKESTGGIGADLVIELSGSPAAIYPGAPDGEDSWPFSCHWNPG